MDSQRLFIEGSAADNVKDLVACVEGLCAKSGESSTLAVDAAVLLETEDHDAVAILVAERAAPVLLRGTPGRETEGAFNLLLATISRAAYSAGSPGCAQSIAITHLITAFTACESIAVAAGYKLRLLANTYNLVDAHRAPELCRSLFLALVDVAAQVGMLQTVMPEVERIETRCTEWGLADADRVQVCADLAKCLIHHGFPSQGLDILIAHVLSDASRMEEAGTALTLAASTLPQFYAFERLETLEAIHALAAHDPYAARLFEVLTRGGLADWRSLLKELPDTAEAFALSKATVETKLRVLALGTAAATSTSVSYSDAAKLLDLADTEDIELWVIQAIRAGALQARLDQPNHMIHLERGVLRGGAGVAGFGEADWRALSGKLATWNSAVTEALTMVVAAREGRRARDAAREEKQAASAE